ncbi:fumarylacetoacetate hydrolase family protein [Halorubraceae archaeon YAN]|nr:fumarylacetoacetate hydrolase family protein [Halorubraceae archaeon YAN]
MRLARVETADGIQTGELRETQVHTEGGTYELGAEATLLSPCNPTAIYCVGRNYAETLEQMSYDRPEEPDFFLKPPASLTGPNTTIAYPSFTDELTYAGELVAVINEQCHRVSPADAKDVIRGYTIMNDLDALDQQGRTARKAFTGSGPLGPWIETALDPTSIDMHTDINGERRQEANTELMLFDPFEIVSYLSERFVFQPGDAIAFGSPANPGLVVPGDTIEITYDGVGTLTNTIGEKPNTPLHWQR